MGQARLGRGARVFAIGVAAVATATGAYAYTNTNTVEASKAGDGTAAISGYTVSDVKYELDTTDPSELEFVRFTLNGEAGSVRAKVVSTDTDYSTCSETTTSDVWECDLDGIAVLDADSLTVVATS
ncbi:hypothetical protein NHL50_14555 [Acidimicrobiia bacterium EGI L10123]|uniref:hypothetical protein n=1 Tax=Salinilacustrithrix flava TaxID=2957203 RepID=UPI003D7C254A|nr:hypothetical protein [Acidimicrobiia bacterium EGI L10123]